MPSISLYDQKTIIIFSQKVDEAGPMSNKKSRHRENLVNYFKRGT